jgi:hypothetical protein
MKRIHYERIVILFFLACIIILPMTACDEEEVTRTYTRVETFRVSNITSEGATFLAEIVEGNNPEIDQTGFVWGSNPGLSIETSEYIFIDKKNIDGNKFSFDVRSTLAEGATYYVRAFVRQGELTIYGQIQSFNSLGSQGPIVSYIEPNAGTIGDTVLIYGENFSNRGESNQVKLGEVTIPHFYTSDSLLKVVIPQTFSQEMANFTVNIYGNVSQEIPFTLTSPIILGFTPEQATDLDEVIIMGNNFAWSDAKNIVTFNNRVATVLEANKSSLVVQIPAGITTAMPEVTVTVAGKTGTSNDVYSMLPPVITDFNPKSGICGDIITITGENFGTLSGTNKVFFNSQEQQIITYSRNELSFKVPTNFSKNQDFLTVISAGQNVVSETELVINAPLIDDFTPKTGTELTEILITGSNLELIGSEPIIKFGTLAGTITQKSSSSIRVKVPIGLNTSPVNISVQIGCYTLVLAQPFHLTGPEIIDFNPKTAQCGEIVTITGNNFSNSNNVNTVQFGGFNSQIIESSPNELKVLVPSTLDASPVKISVETAGQSTLSQSNFSRLFNGPINIVPSLGLVAHYPFDGNALDKTTNLNHGTVNGAELTLDRNGCPNSAYLFDGINDYINLGSSPIFNLATYQAFTFSVWVKANSLSSFNVIFSKYISASSNRSYAFRYAPENKISLMLFQNGGNTNNQSLEHFVDNNWHQITWVYESSGFSQVFVDGVFATSRTFPYPMYPNSSALAVIGATHASGSGQTFDGNFSGSLDEFRLYNRALSAEEIMSLYIGEDCTSCN